jgi:hypothetical protein
MDLPAKGAWFLRRAYHADPGNIVVMLCMLENRLSADDLVRADVIRADIFNRHSVSAIAAALSDATNEIANPEALTADLEKSIRSIGMTGKTL